MEVLLAGLRGQDTIEMLKEKLIKAQDSLSCSLVSVVLYGKVWQCTRYPYATWNCTRMGSPMDLPGCFYLHTSCGTERRNGRTSSLGG